MANTHSYACSDYPGMEACPAHFTAETEAEVMKLMELHASHAHGENPAVWTDEDRTYLKALIKTE
jgi:predicted small metal-binding protein